MNEQLRRYVVQEGSMTLTVEFDGLNELTATEMVEGPIRQLLLVIGYHPESIVRAFEDQ